jgi:hypothetical protein
MIASPNVHEIVAVGGYAQTMRISNRPLENARAMDEQEWQQLLERQEKRMRRKGWRALQQTETRRDTQSKSRVDQNLQRFASLPRQS